VVVKKNEIETKFFTSRQSSEPLVQSVTKFVKGQNNKYQFVENLEKQIGFPYWDKTLVFAGPGTSGRETTGDSIDYCVIPFVRDTENFVNACLIIRTTFSDTTFRILCNWQYQEYSFDTSSTGQNQWNALDVFHMFATLELSVFARNEFIITDGRIFGHDTGYHPRVIMLQNTGRGLQSSRSSTLQPITYCNLFEECGLCAFRSGSNEGGDRCCNPQYHNVCTTIWVETGNGGGGTGGGSGGGTGGGSESGSGWVPPVCPGGNASRSAVIQCIPGWVPGDGGNPPPPSEPIDSLLKKAAELSNIYRGSLSALCEADTSERFFNIVYHNFCYDTFRVIKSHSSEEVNPNYYMTQGRILKAEWHYHLKYDPNTSGSWPSGGDVAKLFDKHYGHVMIIDTYDARYALVVENENQMNIWKNIFGNGPAILPERIYNSVTSDSRVNSSGATYVNMTKEKLLAALGSSSTCGIGVYEASSSHSTTFNKVN
jgi:hypothetical protein